MSSVRLIASALMAKLFYDLLDLLLQYVCEFVCPVFKINIIVFNVMQLQHISNSMF